MKSIKIGNWNGANQLKIALKSSWNHIKWTYFWRILPIVDKRQGVTSSGPRSSISWPWNILSIFDIFRRTCQNLLVCLLPAWHFPKGQLNSEWIFEVIVSPEMQTENYMDFCPTIHTRIIAHFFGDFLVSVGKTNYCN